MVTSAVEAEGKTTTAANLALTLSHSHQRRVLLIDCDLVDDEDRDPAWLTTLVDAPNEGPIRPEVAELVARHPMRA